MPIYPGHSVASIPIRALIPYGEDAWPHTYLYHGLFNGDRDEEFRNKSTADGLKRYVNKSENDKKVTQTTLGYSGLSAEIRPDSRHGGTHLTYIGVNIKLLPKNSIPKSTKTTMIYPHWCRQDLGQFWGPIDDMEL